MHSFNIDFQLIRQQADICTLERNLKLHPHSIWNSIHRLFYSTVSCLTYLQCIVVQIRLMISADSNQGVLIVNTTKTVVKEMNTNGVAVVNDTRKNKVNL